MAGSLIKIDEEIVTSAVASVTLTGIDSTYDVYMVKVNNVLPDTDSKALELRFTKSGTPDTTSNYDIASKQLRADTSFGNLSGTNADKLSFNTIGTAGNEMINAIIYLFNFNSSSEYSFVTFETADRNYQGHLRGNQGGGVHTVASASDGIQFFMTSGNIDSGTFTLYGLKK